MRAPARAAQRARRRTRSINDGGASSGRHPYSYVYNNPASLRDPFGLQAEGGGGGGGGGTYSRSTYGEGGGTLGYTLQPPAPITFSSSSTVTVSPELSAGPVGLPALQLLNAGDARSRMLQAQRQLYTDLMATTTTFAVGATSAGGLIIASPAAAVGLSATAKAALARGLGGAIAGGVSSAISGGEPHDIARGAVVGFTVSWWNPFGPVARSGFTGSWAAAGGLSAGLTNLINQLLGGAINGTEFSRASLYFSVGGGAVFGGWFGATNPAQLGIPFQGSIIQGTGRGFTSGIIGGAAGGVWVNF
jgi:hypothetical protein